MAEEVDDMEYSFYAPNLLYKLIKDREDKLGLAKKVSKKKDKDLKEEEVDDPVKEKWLKIKTVKKTGLLGPTEEKYKNQYIKASGYKYIDLCNAVGADSSVNWYANMLSSDSVHPTKIGRRALALRLIQDMPEIRTI